jgi:hypothetical protein
MSCLELTVLAEMNLSERDSPPSVFRGSAMSGSHTQHSQRTSLPSLAFEQSVFPPSMRGENPGSLFGKCSARNRAKAGAMTTATEADIQIESSNALRRASTANPKRSIRPVKQRSPSADCPGHLFSAHSLRFSVVSLEGCRYSLSDQRSLILSRSRKRVFLIES